MKVLVQGAGYVLDPISNIWRKPGYEGIAYSDGDEVEERIASVIQQALDISVLSAELRLHCTDWPSLYHLSSARANIMRPFDNMLEGDVLEIGAGCGAITRYLGESGANVLALEGSPRRAAITRSRTRDLGNVTVLAEKFDQIQFEHQFDVITLIGVLEYANVFTPGESPARTMLEMVRALLKPNGKLIIAIENQLGMKYFAGAPEDHLGQPMIGIEGRYCIDQPQTFGRKVLAGMLEQAGFARPEFLAPFPDYKLPASVVTEHGFSNNKFDAAAFAWQSVRRDPLLPIYSNFSLELAWPVIFQNELGLDVANSFLVVASPTEQQLISASELAFHYSVDRIPEYCKEAVFLRSDDESIRVEYRRLGAFDNGEDKAICSLISFVSPDSSEYVLGKPLSLEFIEIITKDDWTFDQVAQFVRRYLSIIETFCKLSGIPVSMTSPYAELPGELFDVVPQNIIICEDGSFSVIDKEWQLNTTVEVEYLLFRSLLWLLNSITRLGRPASQMVMTRRQFIDGVFAGIGMTMHDEDYVRYIGVEASVQQSVTGRATENFLTWIEDCPLPTLNLNLALNERDVHIGNLNHVVAERDGLKLQVEHMLGSRSWRVTGPIRAVGGFVRKIVTISNNTNELLKAKGGLIKVLRRSVALILSEGPFVFYRRYEKRILGVGDDYQEWIAKYDTLDEEKIKLLKINAEKFKFTPLISIVMPVYNTPVKYLDLAIKSVQNQVYKNWQLCIADDASTNSDVLNLLKQYAEQDDRIKVVFCEKNGHISKASNAALALATGDYIGLLDHDDILREHALYMVVKELNEYPECKFMYSDEDKITEFGVRVDPFFKPDWNQDLFLSVNYLCHFSVFKAEMIKDIGGFREGYEGSQDYDLQLRITELLKSNEIRHLPYVLYHWRIMPGSTAAGPGEKDYCAKAGLRALNDYLSRGNIRANAELDGSSYRVRYTLPDVPPLVSLIIPTRNSLDLIRQCVDGIHEKTTYPNYEIIIVDNASDDPEVLEYFEFISSEYKAVIHKDDRPFNYSQLNNAAVEIAKGEIIGLINNDIEVISEEWLSEMVSHALRPEVGAVGAKLLYPDDTVQHGGVVLGIGGVAGHSHKHFSKESKGYFGRLGLLSEYSAVTAACLVIKKSIYKQVGGLNEQDLTVAFNDIDFCLRVRESGYRNIWTPYAELYHHESMSRGCEDTPEKQARFEQEVLYMKRQWGSLLDIDPAYSPNLTLKYEDFSYARPPRTELV